MFAARFASDQVNSICKVYIRNVWASSNIFLQFNVMWPSAYLGIPKLDDEIDPKPNS